MDDLGKIRKKLKDSARTKTEEKHLLDLFDRGCEGLGSMTAGGVLAELEERLGSLLDELEEKAASVEAKIKE